MFNIFAAHIEIIKWAHENGCKWDFNTCRCAANDEILKWACNMVVLGEKYYDSRQLMYSWITNILSIIISIII